MFRGLLQQVRAGELDVDDALEQLRHLPFRDLAFAKVDHHRTVRTGMPEVVFGEGKSPQQIVAIVRAMREASETALVTRVSGAAAEAMLHAFPAARYDPTSRTVVVRDAEPQLRGRVCIVTAGTSDLAVAEEAAVTADVLGLCVCRVYDVGVAGLHRVLAHVDELQQSDVVIVVAGMEGALASVVAGLISRPIVAVPTSVGYGASFGGLAALLGMLSGCAPGVSVVNIDNGFGAACVAVRMMHAPR